MNAVFGPASVSPPSDALLCNLSTIEIVHVSVPISALSLSLSVSCSLFWACLVTSPSSCLPYHTRSLSVFITVLTTRRLVVESTHDPFSLGVLRSPAEPAGLIPTRRPCGASHHQPDVRVIPSFHADSTTSRSVQHTPPPVQNTDAAAAHGSIRSTVYSKHRDVVTDIHRWE